MSVLSCTGRPPVYRDHILVKEPGTTAATPWHHDLQAWPIEGRQIASLWLALDPITRETGTVVPIPEVGSLHYRYVRRAA